MDKKTRLIVERISKLPYVSCLFLFGSHANGKPRADSDIDIAVLTNKTTKQQEYEIMGFSNPGLDISVFNRLPIVIQFRILKEGKLLFCRNQSDLHETKVKTFRHYLDFSYFANSFYKKVIKNV
jgi:predicted nucleotidyltransferase